MEIRMSTDIQFAPNEQFNLLSFMKLLPPCVVSNKKQYYAHLSAWF